MKMIYEVVDNGVDGWARWTVGYFESKRDAEAVRKTETSYGQGSIEKCMVFESVEDYKAYKKASAISNAKSKLSKEERELLGLD